MQAFMPHAVPAESTDVAVLDCVETCSVNNGALIFSPLTNCHVIIHSAAL
jgi:hypothetical protein